MRTIVVFFCLISMSLGNYISIGTKTVPPFVFYDGQSSAFPIKINDPSLLRGFTIDILKELLKVLPKDKYQGYNFTLYEGNTQGINAITNNEISTFAAALTETSERERFVDFVSFFDKAGLGIMVHDSIDSVSTFGNVMNAIFSLQTLIFLAMFVCLLIGLAMLYYASDKICRNPKRNLFPDNPKKGIVKALGYSFLSINLKEVPMPQTNCTWIIFVVATLLNVFFTALVTASLTNIMKQAIPQQKIGGYDDLVNIKVATVENSISHQYMVQNGGGMIISKYSTVDLMIDGFLTKKNGEEAMLYDLPILQYLKGNDDRFVKTKLVGDAFDISKLGFALSNIKGQLHEDMNIGILELIKNGVLLSLRERWFKESQFNTNQENDDTLLSSLTVLLIVAGAVLGLGLILSIIIGYNQLQKIKEDEKKYGLEKDDGHHFSSDWLNVIFRQDSIQKRQKEIEDKTKALQNTSELIKDVTEFEAPHEILHRTVDLERSLLGIGEKLNNLMTKIEKMEKQSKSSDSHSSFGAPPPSPISDQKDVQTIPQIMPPSLTKIVPPPEIADTKAPYFINIPKRSDSYEEHDDGKGGGFKLV